MAIDLKSGLLNAGAQAVQGKDANPLDLAKGALGVGVPFNRDDALKQAAGHVPGGAAAAKAADVVTGKGSVAGAATDAAKAAAPQIPGGAFAGAAGQQIGQAPSAQAEVDRIIGAGSGKGTVVGAVNGSQPLNGAVNGIAFSDRMPLGSTSLELNPPVSQASKVFSGNAATSTAVAEPKSFRDQAIANGSDIHVTALDRLEKMKEAPAATAAAPAAYSDRRGGELQVAVSPDQPVDLEKVALENLVKLQKQVVQTVTSGLPADEQIKALSKIEGQMKVAHRLLGKDLDFAKVVGKALNENAEKFAQSATREQAIAARDDLKKVEKHFRAEAPLAHAAVDGKIAVFDKVAQEQKFAQQQALKVNSDAEIQKVKNEMRETLLNPDIDVKAKMDLLASYQDRLKAANKQIGKNFDKEDFRETMGEIFKSKEFQDRFAAQLKSLSDTDLQKLNDHHDAINHDNRWNAGAFGVKQNNGIENALDREIGRRAEIAKEQASAPQQAAVVPQVQPVAQVDITPGLIGIQETRDQIKELLLKPGVSPEERIAELVKLELTLKKQNEALGRDFDKGNFADFREVLGEIIKSPEFAGRFQGVLTSSSREELVQLNKFHDLLNRQFGNGAGAVQQNNSIENALDKQIALIDRLAREQAAAVQQAGIQQLEQNQKMEVASFMMGYPQSEYGNAQRIEQLLKDYDLNGKKVLRATLPQMLELVATTQASDPAKAKEMLAAYARLADKMGMGEGEFLKALNTAFPKDRFTSEVRNDLTKVVKDVL